MTITRWRTSAGEVVMYQFERVGSIASGIVIECRDWSAADFRLVRDAISIANLEFFGSRTGGCRLFVPGCNESADVVIIGTSGVCAELVDEKMEFETDEVVDGFEDIHSVDKKYWERLRRQPLLVNLGTEIRNWLVAQGATRTLIALGDMQGGPVVEIATVADEQILPIDFSRQNIETWHEHASAIDEAVLFIETSG